MSTLSATIRRYLAGFLGLALLAALWTTCLARISDKPTAVSLLTDAGTQLVNPLLVSNGTGITMGTYQQLEREAAAHPNQPVQILFIKPAILGSDIAGKNYPQALQVIFGKVAEAYYAGGPGAAFDLPPQLQSVVGAYTPFIAMQTSLPGVPQSPLPQLPSFVAPLFAHIGFTPATLTADGHSAVVSLSRWLWLASGVLALLVALLGAGWARLKTIAWAVFHSAWHITLLIAVAAYLVSRNPTQAAPYRDVLGLIGGAFFPVYAAATVAGLAGVIVCSVVARRPRQRAQTSQQVAIREALAQAMSSGGYPSVGYPPAGTSTGGGFERGGYAPPATYTPQPPQPQELQQAQQAQPESQFPAPQFPAYPESVPQPARPQQPVFPEASPLAPEEDFRQRP